MKLLVYVIGVPGAGKTTLLNAMFKGWGRASYYKPIAHAIYTRGSDATQITELGARRDPFGGTDALAMDALPHALDFLAPRSGVVIAEGDRLTTPKFWDGARALGWQVHVALLDAAPELALLRRHQRSSVPQNEKWLKGRETKIANLAPTTDLYLNAQMDPEFLGAVLLGMISRWSAHIES